MSIADNIIKGPNTWFADNDKPEEITLEYALDTYIKVANKVFGYVTYDQPSTITDEESFNKYELKLEVFPEDQDLRDTLVFSNISAKLMFLKELRNTDVRLLNFFRTNIYLHRSAFSK